MPSPNGRAARGAAGAATHPARRLEITLVPRPLWGYDLRKKVRDELWRQLEAAACCDTDGRCAICGGRPTSLEPRWKYDERRGVATLVGFELLCPYCYFGRHPGHASEVFGQDELDQVNAHYRRVNGITSDLDWLHDLDGAFEEWHRRNLIDWRADLGVFAVFAQGRQHVS